MGLALSAEPTAPKQIVEGNAMGMITSPRERLLRGFTRPELPAAETQLTDHERRSIAV
jgi:hypothetical protein